MRPNSALRAVRGTLALAAIALALLSAGPARADCVGRDLLAELPPIQAAALDAALTDQPFPRGNRWRATRKHAAIELVGTLHLDDPRMDGVMDRLGPVVDRASLVLLEATDAEMKALQEAMARRPELMFLQEGSLIDLLGDRDWADLAPKMEARGIPGFMAAKLQPWFVTMMLSLPACAIDTGKPGGAADDGLDRRVMDRAAAAGVEMRALEPYDTLFTIFNGFSRDEQLDMIRITLPLADQAEDMYATTVESYFSEEHRRLWEYSRLVNLTLPGQSRDKAAADFARAEQALLTDRNHAWMDVITGAAAGSSIDAPVVVAVGAAHLSGPDGLLKLLADAGWTLERQPF